MVGVPSQEPACRDDDGPAYGDCWNSRVSVACLGWFVNLWAFRWSMASLWTLAIGNAVAEKLVAILLVIGGTALSQYARLLNWPAEAWVSIMVTAYAGASVILVFQRRARKSSRTMGNDGPPTASEWHEQEERFAKIPGEVEAHWAEYSATGLVKWNIQHQTDRGRRGSRTGTVRDRQLFQSEAEAAGMMVRRMGDAMPAKLTGQAATDPADDWLNAVIALAHPGNAITGSGSDGIGELGLHKGGIINNAIEASKVACARLAADARKRM